MRTHISYSFNLDDDYMPLVCVHEKHGKVSLSGYGENVSFSVTFSPKHLSVVTQLIEQLALIEFQEKRKSSTAP